MSSLAKIIIRLKSLMETVYTLRVTKCIPVPSVTNKCLPDTLRDMVKTLAILEHNSILNNLLEEMFKHRVDLNME